MQHWRGIADQVSAFGLASYKDEERFFRDVKARRMATDSRSLWAQGLAARERCQAACLSRMALMSALIETLQKYAPC
jgi:hypothetical protein